MIEETINRLKNIIAAKQFVNCFSSKFSLENQGELELLLAKLKEGYSHIYVDINIHCFNACESEDQEAGILLERINGELITKGCIPIRTQAISIANALQKLSSGLGGRALLVFHFFHDLYDEKEKNILRSLRKAHRNELKSSLGILIASHKKISKWELYPESNLDERHVEFFEY